MGARKEHTKVSPLVRVIVQKGRVDVGITTDGRPPSDTSDSRADLCASLEGSVTWNTYGTYEVPVVKLVDHQSFEAISHRVNPINPPTPAKHVIGGHDEAGKDDNGEDEYSSWSHGLREGAGDGSDGAEQHGHDQSQEERDQQEKKEWSRFSTEI